MRSERHEPAYQPEEGSLSAALLAEVANGLAADLRAARARIAGLESVMRESRVSLLAGEPPSEIARKLLYALDPCTCGLAGTPHERGVGGCIFPSAPSR